MEVILKSDVQGLGREGDLVTVADGYGRNYLIPKGMALFATDKNRRILEHYRSIQDIRETKERREAEHLMARLSGVTCVMRRLAGENGRLFGSVTAMDIADALLAKGFTVDRRRLEIEESIRELGTYTASLRLHKDIVAQITIQVVAEESA